MATRGSSLLDQPVLLVHQRAKLFEVRNQYQLMDGAGQPVGVVEQVNQSPLAVFSRIFSNLDTTLPMELQVRDTAGATALTLNKPWFRLAVTVTGGDGTAYGSVRKQVRVGKARFSLLDPGGNLVGEALAQNWRARDFVVNDANGVEIARVTKQWAGAAKELFTDADNYVIQVSPTVVGPLRGLAIAATWAIDIVMKQKDAGS